jgi:hypothetical protein
MQNEVNPMSAVAGYELLARSVTPASPVESIVERKLRWRRLTEDGNAGITDCEVRTRQRGASQIDPQRSFPCAPSQNAERLCVSSI